MLIQSRKVCGWLGTAAADVSTCNRDCRSWFFHRHDHLPEIPWQQALDQRGWGWPHLCLGHKEMGVPEVDQSSQVSLACPLFSRCQSSWGLTVDFLLEDMWPSFPFTHLASWPCLWVQIRHWGESWRPRSTFTKLWTLVFKFKSPPPGVAVLQEYWSGWPFPSPEDLPNPSLLHCTQILDHLSHQGSWCWYCFYTVCHCQTPG